MPVTIDVAPHGANPLRTDRFESAHHSPEALLFGAAPAKWRDVKSVIQSSFKNNESDPRTVSPCDNGLVRTAFQAYTSHHHLVLRPEDIWFAILSQFSFYVNANAEALRKKFVAHEGKVGLVLSQAFDSLESIDYGDMCINMTKLIETAITDPTLRAWIMPSWTTTTTEDTIIASVCMMGTLQRYFEYIFDPSCCGIPTVTLLGERADWTDLATRVERLGEYGDEPSLFRDLLRPIARGFVKTFDAPHDECVKNFWRQAIDHQHGSGMNHLSGWITAFMVWDEQGKFRIKDRLIEGTKNAAAKAEKAGHLELHPLSMTGWAGFGVDLDQIPAGFVFVPVKLKNPATNLMIDTELLAGSVGMEAVTAAELRAWWPDPIERKTGATDVQKYGKDQRGASSKFSKVAQRFKRAICGNKGSSSASSDTESFVTTSTLVTDKDKVVTSTKPPLEHAPPSEGDPPSTLKPATGWWMYQVKGGELDGKQVTLPEFLESRKETWTGQKKGTVDLDGSFSVE
ncbi:hypothetical protein F5Y16DRAFT_372916 [Xylariaceae sp. FL0255]|nr:hypothetical protein F5Y16DRAFT_372916 [Xylariaceae sp. FL0255]